MLKKTFAVTTLAALAFAGVAFAQNSTIRGTVTTPGTANPPTTTNRIDKSTQKTAKASVHFACIGAAVATREATLDVAVTTHMTSIQNAYNTRAIALSAAYAGTADTTATAAIKAAWSTFNTSIKTAASTWKTSQLAAWKTFKTASTACKVPASITDTTNAVSEMSGS